MSKCLVCNKELTTGDAYSTICNRCYNEIGFAEIDCRKFIDEEKVLLYQENKELKYKITDLEAKLAESEKRLVNCVDFNTWQKTAKENNQLKQKLAEKEKEIKNLVLAHFESETNKPVLTTTQIINQDKISFAVEQLEKVKELCKKKFAWWENSEWEGNVYDKVDVANAYFDIEANIDNQIKQLREMK